jgi:hypothetical protein
MAAFVQTLIFLNYLLGYLFVNHSSHNQTFFSFEFLEKLDLHLICLQFPYEYVKKFDFCYLIKICKN